MAGKSERFKQKGYPTDKYRLPLGGLTVFEHAVISFKAYFEEYIFLFIHSDKNNTKNFIQEKCQSMGLKKTRVISLNENTFKYHLIPFFKGSVFDYTKKLRLFLSPPQILY